MNDFVIETNDLTKCYGEQVCVAQLCLHVPKGKIYALLGRNGAGKTTTMKMLLNLVKPTSGFIKIFNDIHVFRIGLDDKIYKDILVDQKREIHV